ncbi:MAG: hypothetical protein J6P81_00800 [Spirochaetales bacterium]|nr:hypothetical protein [Spirochaetales bacterium]
MKKGIIVLLIAVLVSGFAFADFSGNAGVRFDAFFGDDSGAFITSNVKSFDFSFTFTSEKVELDSAEDEIHVEVAASAKFIFGEINPADMGDWKNGEFVTTSDLSDRGIGAVIKLDTAKIVGKNWYVSVLGTQDAYDYAKAPVLTIKNKKVKDDFGNVKKYTTQAASYVVDYNKVPGVTVGFNGFTASAGFDYVKLGSDKFFVASASVETPEFAFNDDTVKVQAAAEFSRLGLSGTSAKAVDSVIGASAKATVAIQDITIGVATDLGLEYIGAEVGTLADKDTEFNIDARVDFKYNFVDVNLYTYAGKAGLKFGSALNGVYSKFNDFYLEAKAAFDLNAFELPLKVTVSAKNITNAEVGGDLRFKYGIEPKVEVEFAKDAIKAGASFSINTEDKIWDALVYGTYAFEKFTAGAGVSLMGFEGLRYIAFGAFAESDKLVKGATFGLAYGLDGDDAVYSDGAAACVSDSDNYSANYKADPVEAGEIVAYCKIAF